MQTDRFEFLLEHYLEGALSPAEWEELSGQLGHGAHTPELRRAIDQVLKDRRFAGVADKRKTDALFSGILRSAEKESGEKRRIFGMTPYRAAAAVAAAILLVAGGWLFHRHGGSPVAQRVVMRNVRPGGNNAVLILAGGTTVVLDSARNGTIANQGNTQVVKRNGLLSYLALPGAPGEASKVSYNMVVTPRGGAYEVLLPDSSRAWLNAASSLHFPTSFQGTNREVSLTGEAYFEIRDHASRPFIVHIYSAEGTPEGQVRVLGTHFNINAYDEEPAIKTTLVAGKIRVTARRDSLTLSPGEEADLNKGGTLNLHKNVDTQEAVAWKNDLFLFRNTDIRVVMRQIARWYDIEVNYAGSTQARLSGIISRNTELPQVLHMLELTREVHFRTAGKIVTVTP